MKNPMRPARLLLLAAAFLAALAPSFRSGTAQVNPPVPLLRLTDTVYQTEHCLFLIANSGSVVWPQYDSVYSQSNLSSYFSELKSRFPDDYFTICVLAKSLTPARAPIYTHLRWKATGIYDHGAPGATDYCRYHLGSGTVIDGALGVFDHEIGHAWGVQILGQPGHWLSNSTVDCQMADSYTDDGGYSVLKISGDEQSGFRWVRVDNLRRNETEVFSLQQLYLMGLNPSFPAFHVLGSPVYNADQTMSYSSLTRYDQSSMVAGYGERTPDFRTSQKRFKFGFVYVARDIAEVQEVYLPIERSINHFCNADTPDVSRYRFQVPFVYETRYRASADATLADLNGNARPSLTIQDPYVTSSDGTAQVRFTAVDPDGGAPTVACVPANSGCSVAGGQIRVTGLLDGVHFFTAAAVDAGGKKSFDHFVVEAHRTGPTPPAPPSNLRISASDGVGPEPLRQPE
jgi:hypothetical protein